MSSRDRFISGYSPKAMPIDARSGNALTSDAARAQRSAASEFLMGCSEVMCRAPVNRGVRWEKKGREKFATSNTILSARAGFLKPDTEVGRRGDGASVF